MRIKKLSSTQLWYFVVLCLKHPLLILPTLKATKQTFQVCNELFGNEHQKSNKANAFRHALWNVLICKKSMKSLKNKQKSVFWGQKVTDLYEKVTQNEPLDEAMDLHNNAIGRMCFLNYLGKNEEEMVVFLQNRAKNAIKITYSSNLNLIANQMVYIED